MTTEVVERIMSAIDDEGAKLSLADYLEVLQSVRSRVQCNIDAALEDRRRRTR